MRGIEKCIADSPGGRPPGLYKGPDSPLRGRLRVIPNPEQQHTKALRRA